LDEAATTPKKPSGWKAWLISACLWVESHLLPLFFLALAAHTAWGFVQPLAEPMFGAETPLELTGELLRQLAHPGERAEGAPTSILVFALLHHFVRPALMVSFDLLCAFLIAFRTHLQYEPSSLREVLIPIGGTFCMALLPLSVYLPAWATAPFSYPAIGTQILLLGGIGLALAGQLTALWGIAHLRRNFAIFVEVREVVLTGPYRIVRHPLYTGEVAMAAGAVAMFPTVVGALAVAVLGVFQHLRARMEETALGRASPEYARRVETTGAFLPRWTGDSHPEGSSGGQLPGLRAALSALAVAVLLANVSTMLRGYDGVPDRASQPLRSYVYDAFMVYHLFTGFSPTNSEAEVFGHRPETGWVPIEMEGVLPFRRGQATLRLRAWHHEHLDDATDARRFLAAKIRQRYNRLHPEAPVAAVAFGLWRWPSSAEGYYARKTVRASRFQPWFAEPVPE